MALRFRRTDHGRGGYLHGDRISLAYRGFRQRPFIRTRPIRIGAVRLYALGPLALFIGRNRQARNR